jgi:hypothetical protein
MHSEKGNLNVLENIQTSLLKHGRHDGHDAFFPNGKLVIDQGLLGSTFAGHYKGLPWLKGLIFLQAHREN